MMCFGYFLFAFTSSVPLLARRYQFLEVIGEGGSSITIRAKDTFRPDDFQVAIKVLSVNYYRLGYQVGVEINPVFTRSRRV